MQLFWGNNSFEIRKDVQRKLREKGANWVSF